MKSKIRLLVTATLAASAAGSSGLAQGPSNTRHGAAVGGLAGAVIGGIVGHQNDEVPEGALIGGAVGALAGGVLGHTKDAAAKRGPYYPQPQPVYQAAPVYRTTPVYHAAPTYAVAPAVTTTTARVAIPRVFTVSDAITLTRSGVSDTVIINQIHTKGVAAAPEVNEVVLMHEQGVSDAVISVMQQVGSSAPAVEHVATQDVVVVEQPTRVVAVPSTVVPVYRPAYVYPHHHHHRRHY